MNEFEDQYMTTGAMNFPAALTIAAEMFDNLNEQAKEEVNLVVIDRAGSVFIIGQGDLFPTNEQAPIPQGFIIYRDDILEFFQDEEAHADSVAEEAIQESNEEIGNNAEINSADIP